MVFVICCERRLADIDRCQAVRRPASRMGAMAVLNETGATGHVVHAQADVFWVHDTRFHWPSVAFTSAAICVSFT